MSFDHNHPNMQLICKLLHSSGGTLNELRDLNKSWLLFAICRFILRYTSFIWDGKIMILCFIESVNLPSIGPIYQLFLCSPSPHIHIKHHLFFQAYVSSFMIYLEHSQKTLAHNIKTYATQEYHRMSLQFRYKY